MGEFETVMQTLDFVSGLHNCREAFTEREVSNSSDSPDKTDKLALTDGEVLGETDALALTNGNKLGGALDEAV